MGALPIEANDMVLVQHPIAANLTFLYGFVSLKKRIILEGCWFFTLKFMNPVSRNRDYSAKHLDW